MRKMFFLGSEQGLLHNHDVLKSEFGSPILFMISIKLMIVLQCLLIVQHNKDSRYTTNK